jgi:hypothetical protein
MKSKSYRLAWFSFIFAVIIIALGLIEEITISEHTIKLRMIDPYLALALMAPSQALYGFRRYTAARWGKDKEDI